DQPVPVEAVQRGVEAVVGPVVMNGFGDLRRVPHDFLGHAAHIDAGAAKLFGLDQRAFLSVHGGAVGGRDAAAAAADGDVVVVLGHVLPVVVLLESGTGRL